jgi:hypothetical protein
VDATLGAFDTVLMMCGNLGLVGTADDAVPILRLLHAMTTPSGRIVLDSVDPYERRRGRSRVPGAEPRAWGRRAR